MSRPGAWGRVLSNLWKYLRKDWSYKEYVGEDSAGNRFYEIKNTKSNVKRSFTCFKLSGYHAPVGVSNSEVSVEWQAWLKGTRRFPPSDEEIALNKMKQQAQLAQNAETERRAPHVATIGSNQPRNKPEAFPSHEDFESAPGSKTSGK
ncbi:hypothetical protein DICVIV_09488 [Dictyocaulus viviparus]|uniref:NADH dehydrogenase [ubiquinone] 1 alpha subcomplex subunit 12 n=1 Tax=Dictyocaulus viviparus TaxID=29172 RepID=A0A0D8XIK0_DICVI|nr:hypothetical protein DICVIV_09488 [Dictyocaulus viviparus]